MLPLRRTHVNCCVEAWFPLRGWGSGWGTHLLCRVLVGSLELGCLLLVDGKAARVVSQIRGMKRVVFDRE